MKTMANQHCGLAVTLTTPGGVTLTSSGFSFFRNNAEERPLNTSPSSNSARGFIVYGFCVVKQSKVCGWREIRSQITSSPSLRNFRDPASQPRLLTRHSSGFRISHTYKSDKEKVPPKRNLFFVADGVRFELTTRLPR